MLKQPKKAAVEKAAELDTSLISVSLEPTTFEVHFFPDRHIEVAISDSYSPSRLKLARAGAGYRVGKDVQKEDAQAQRLDAQSAECRNGRFPIGGSS